MTSLCKVLFCTVLTSLHFFVCGAKGQGREVDSLKNLIFSSNVHDTVQVNACLELVAHIYLHDPDSALLFCNHASELSEDAGFMKGSCESYGWLGFLHNQLGDIETALFNYKKSLNMNRQLGDTLGIATILNNMGAILDGQGNILEALEFYNESLKLREQINDQEGVATVLNNLGVIYLNQEDRKAAMDYFQRSSELSKSIDDHLGVANSLNNIAGILEEEGEYAEALNKYNEALEILQKANHKWAMAITIGNIGFVHDLSGAKDTALSYYRKGLRIQEEIGDQGGMANTLHNIGYIEYERGRNSSAAVNATQGLMLARSVGSPHLVSKNCRLLSLVSEKQGDFKEALKYFTEHIEMRDSIRNRETEKASIRQQLHYEYEKREAIKATEHQKELAVAAEKKKKQEIISMTVGGGLLMISLFALFVFDRLKLSRKQNVIINHQKSKVEAQHQEITDSINYARRLQESILPSIKRISSHLQLCFCLYKPKDIVAGDFYFFDVVEEDGVKQIFLAVADCTGHGVRGAMVSIVGANGLKRCIREFNLREPGDILTKLSDIVSGSFSQNESVIYDGLDIALCRIEVNAGERPLIHYAGAYNPLWVFNSRRDNIPECATDLQELMGFELKPTRKSIGYAEDRVTYETSTFRSEQGDMLYFFTDGFVDQFGGEQRKKYKSANFKRLLSSIHQKDLSIQRELLDNTFVNWKGENEQLDDVCVMGIRM